MSATITRIEVDGLRTLDKFSLDLRRLTVLIGENGSGKSSIIEACELLRRLTTPQFGQEYVAIHGGDAMLQRSTGSPIRLGVTVADDTGASASYEVAFTNRGIEHEVLRFQSKKKLFERTQKQVEAWDRGGQTVKIARPNTQVPLIARHGWSHPEPEIATVSDALANIEVHLPFDTLAHWAAKSQGSRGSSAARDSVTVVPASKLERFGQNLPNAYFSLRNELSAAEWDYIMDLVRLGLGNWVESVNTRPDGGGKIALWLKRRNTDLQIPAIALSDGQLAYLGFVALTQLNPARSLLCFDEPDLHLHPSLMARVVSLLGETAERHPVLLATHSRRLLDELDDPADAVAVCELNPDEFRTNVHRLDRARLNAWLESYDGLGHVLDAGYEPALLSPTAKAGAPE